MFPGLASGGIIVAKKTCETGEKYNVQSNRREIRKKEENFLSVRFGCATLYIML